MAEIFLAKSMSIQGMAKHVAIKRVLPSLAKNEKFIAMFLDEARLSLVLNHANIVQVFDVAEASGTYFIVMEYVDGYNLRHLYQRATERKRRIPVGLVCHIMQEVCKGLEHAHTKRNHEGKHLRIVHRDLSPPNILVSRSGEIKITDFGLAKATSQLSTTDPGVVKGKYSYLSPEVTTGNQADLRTDIFAAGIIMWELLANRRLFFGKSDVETVNMVRAAKIPSLSQINPEVSPALEQIINKALAKDPGQRYASARALGEELAELSRREGLAATSYGLAQLLEELFDGDSQGGGDQEDSANIQRRERILAMIDEEINNLSIIGYSDQVRSKDGASTVDEKKLSLGQVHRPIFDLERVWTQSGPPVSLKENTQSIPPALEAMRELKDLAGLAQMLEGSHLTPLPTVAKAPTLLDSRPPERSSGPSKGVLITLFLILVAIGTVLALLFIE